MCALGWALRWVAKKPSKGKLRRCDLLLKGVANLNLPAGQSYLTFTGKWGRKKLARGKYVLSVRSPKLNDSPKAILNVVR